MSDCVRHLMSGLMFVGMRLMSLGSVGRSGVVEMTRRVVSHE